MHGIDDEELASTLCRQTPVFVYSARRQAIRKIHQLSASRCLFQRTNKEFWAFDTYFVLLVGTQAKTTQFLPFDDAGEGKETQAASEIFGRAGMWVGVSKRRTRDVSEARKSIIPNQKGPRLGTYSQKV